MPGHSTAATVIIKLLDMSPNFPVKLRLRVLLLALLKLMVVGLLESKCRSKIVVTGFYCCCIVIDDCRDLNHLSSHRNHQVDLPNFQLALLLILIDSLGQIQFEPNFRQFHQL